VAGFERVKYCARDFGETGSSCAGGRRRCVVRRSFRHDCMGGYSMSICIYALPFECVWISFRRLNGNCRCGAVASPTEFELRRCGVGGRSKPKVLRFAAQRMGRPGRRFAGPDGVFELLRGERRR